MSTNHECSETNTMGNMKENDPGEVGLFQVGWLGKS